MLDAEEVRALIVFRLFRAFGSCSSHHLNHVEGQIRGLLAVLNGGKSIDPQGDARTILGAAKVPWSPHHDDPNGWAIPNEWLEAHGFTIEGSSVRHQKFEAAGW